MSSAMYMMEMGSKIMSEARRILENPRSSDSEYARALQIKHYGEDLYDKGFDEIKSWIQ